MWSASCRASIASPLSRWLSRRCLRQFVRHIGSNVADKLPGGPKESGHCDYR